MFTGLIEEIGIIKNIRSLGGGKSIRIGCNMILSDSKVDDSISINGVCQTVTSIDSNSFEVTAVEETINRTTVKNWKVNQKVNLERAMKLSDRLGGHLLLGHVDDIGRIVNISELGSSSVFEISFPEKYSKYIINKGSIAVDGISLTVMDLKDNSFSISIIPHTLENSILKYLKSGDEVNLEFDVIGKYVEKMLEKNNEKSGLTLDKLRELGY